MADPLTIIGTVSSLANIIDTASKTITAVRELHGRWKEADLAFLSLAAQLTALRAALTKIQDWISGLLEDPDYQLTLDLDVALSCCGLLVGKLEMFIQKIDHTTDEPLDFASKSKFLFGATELDNVQKMVERQVSALTLLLTACNCKTTSEQHTLLQAPSIRKVMNRVENDSASLCVLRDSASFSSRWSDNLSKLSLRFEFDKELFASSVYDRVFRKTVRNSFQQHHLFRGQNFKRLTERPKPSNIPFTRKLSNDSFSKNTQQEIAFKVILVGGDFSGKSKVFRQMRIRFGGQDTEDEVLALRDMVRRDLRECVGLLLKQMRDTDPQVESLSAEEPWASVWTSVLPFENVLDEQHKHKPLPTDTVDALRSLREDPFAIESMENFEDVDLSMSIQYFLSEAERISSPGYVPNSDDLMNLRIGTSRIDRFRMHYQGVCEINFLDVGVQTFDCQDDCLFDDVNCIAFVVNVSSYDVFTGLSCELNALERQIQFFDRVTKVTWSKTTSVVVILRNIDEMENKLGQNPFSRYFHDFEDSNDAYSVLRYIKGRITSANLNNCSLNFHIT